MTSGNERGQVTVFVAVFMIALIGLAGLVIDGGVALAARRRAINEAQGAARAGAEALDETIYRASGVRKIDESEAERKIAQYMAAAHSTAAYNVGFPAADMVDVDVTFDQSLNILGAFGVGSITARGHGSARTVHGITQEDR